MGEFTKAWGEAAYTSVGFFWMALWAFALGYLVSSLIQVLVTRERMKRTMGESGPKSVGLATFFGFVSSSCSFAALSTTRALLKKGAGLVPATAFLLSSTNLVIELGIVISLFLGWQFVVGEYAGGILLVLLAWIFIRLTRPGDLIAAVRERLGRGGDEDDGEVGDWREKATSIAGWERIGAKYVMEWQMVWKDVLIGFTVAGIIAAFVPDSFFRTLFVGAGSANPGFPAVLAQVIVGPVAAFFTFIGSMGNIPLAALLYDRGVCFAGVMAFIFSDLVVLPVLRINARYYGWRMALYLLAMLLACLVVAALLLHYGLLTLDLLPKGGGGSTAGQELFALDYGFWLNLLFLAASAALAWLGWRRMGGGHHHGDGSGPSTADRILRGVCLVAGLWLAGGLMFRYLG